MRVLRSRVRQPVGFASREEKGAALVAWAALIGSDGRTPPFSLVRSTTGLALRARSSVWGDVDGPRSGRLMSMRNNTWSEDVAGASERFDELQVRTDEAKQNVQAAVADDRQTGSV